MNDKTRKRAIWLVMDHLRHGEELMTCIQTRLARRLLILSSETSALVRDLERDGLVTWRRGSVMLTDLGVDWLEDRT